MTHHYCAIAARLGLSAFGFAVNIVRALGLLIFRWVSWWTPVEVD